MKRCAERFEENDGPSRRSGEKRGWGQMQVYTAHGTPAANSWFTDPVHGTPAANSWFTDPVHGTPSANSWFTDPVHGTPAANSWFTDPVHGTPGPHRNNGGRVPFPETIARKSSFFSEEKFCDNCNPK